MGLWWWGFWAGMVACTWLAAHTILHHRIYPLLQPRLPKKKRPPPLAEELLFRVVEDGMLSADGEESSEWLNGLFNLLFSEFIGASSHLRDDWVVNKLRRMVVDVGRRGWMGILVREAELVDWTLGDNMPQLNVLRWCDAEEVDGVLCGDLLYEGGLELVARFRLIGDLDVYLRVGVDAVEGPVFYCFQGKALHYGFHHLTALSMHARLLVEGVGWWQVDWLLSHVVLPLLFRRRFCLPHFRSRWLVDRPSGPYYPWDPEIRRDPSLLYQ